jgi:hypothetical protein
MRIEPVGLLPGQPDRGVEPRQWRAHLVRDIVEQTLMTLEHFPQSRGHLVEMTPKIRQFIMSVS